MLAIFHSKTAQAVATWLSIFSAIFTVLIQLTPDWFGALTWPQSILLGIGFAFAAGLLFSIMLAIGGFGFRLIKPLPAAPSEPITLDYLAASGFLGITERRLDELEAAGTPETVGMIADLKDQLAATDKRVLQLGVDQGGKELKGVLEVAGLVRKVDDLAKAVEAMPDYGKQIADIEGIAQGARGEAKNVGDVLGLRIQQMNERMDAVATKLAEREQAAEVATDMARLAWLDSKIGAFTKGIENLESNWRDLDRSLATANALIGTGPHLHAWTGALRFLVDWLGQDSPVPLNLSAHPNYDKNPARRVPGEELMPDEEAKFDFRRCYDQYQTALNLLKKAHEKLIEERNRLTSQVQEQGRIAGKKIK